LGTETMLGTTLLPLGAVDSRLLSTLTLIALAVVVAGGLLAIYFLRREVKERPPTDEELLTQFQQAHDAGEMDEAEFRRVSALLKGRIAQKLSAEVAGPTTSEEAPQPRAQSASPPEPPQSENAP